MNFSTDADLLKWEPALGREVVLDHQTLAAGTGATADEYQVTAPGADFLAANVRAGHVVHLANPDQGVDGHYEVVSVETATELLATVVGTAGEQRIPLPAATDLDYAIRTFDPQHDEARWTLLERLGLEQDASDPTADLSTWIAQQRTLRRASVALVLATIYRGQMSSDGPGGFRAKAEHYERLYEDAVTKARVALDRDGDGLADDVRDPSCIRLRRA